MAHKRKDILVAALQWWWHLRPYNKRRVTNKSCTVAQIPLSLLSARPHNRPQAYEPESPQVSDPVRADWNRQRHPTHGPSSDSARPSAEGAVAIVLPGQRRARKDHCRKARFPGGQRLRSLRAAWQGFGDHRRRAAKGVAWPQDKGRRRLRRHAGMPYRSEEHTSELQSLRHLVC